MTIVNWRDIVRDSRRDGTAFYNGGWVKAITAVDKGKSNGYCFAGGFISGAVDGMVEVEDGLYITCSIAGSRKNQNKEYAVYQVSGDEVTQVLDWVDGRDWALKLRDKVAELLAEKVEPVELPADELALVEQLRALEPERLAAVMAALK